MEHLLFITEEQFEARQAERADWRQTTAEDLGLEALCQRLYEQNALYNDGYLRHFNTDGEIARYRAGIMAEIDGNEGLYRSLTLLARQIAAYQVHFRAFVPFPEGVARQYLYLSLLAEYEAVMDEALGILQNTKAAGFAAQYRALLADADTFLVPDRARRAVLSDALHHTLAGAFFLNGTEEIRVSTAVPTGDFMGELADLARELLQITLDTEFSLISHGYNEPEQELISKLAAAHPALFSELSSLYLSVPVAMLGRLTELLPQILYYTEMAAFAKACRQKGISFCVPRFGGKSVSARDMVDIGLVCARFEEERPVGNDFDGGGFSGFLLTGANQGGKTTFLRSLGLSLLLAGCGLLVPAASFSLEKVFAVHTLFAKGEEDMLSAGRLLEDIRAFGAFWENAAPSDLLLMNEPFAGTRRSEALFFLREAVGRLGRRGVFYGCVTHFYELAELLPEGETLLLRALVDPKDSRKRLYKIVPDRPERLAYAADIVEKCGMTPAHIGVLLGIKGEGASC